MSRLSRDLIAGRVWTIAAGMTPRTASAALLPLDEARVRLTAEIVPVATRKVPVWESVGAVSAEDVLAQADLPGMRVAARDGYAVDFIRMAGASPYAPVLLAQEPAWIEAGEPLPPGTDTVLPPEALEAVSGRSQIVADAPEGDGTRAPGGELRRGALVVRAGRRITELSALALAAAGHGDVVVRAPRIALLATGPEGPARAVSHMLAKRLTRAGAASADVASVPDDSATIAEALSSAAADAVFLVGGTGFGRTDLSAAALTRAGTLAAHGIALRPCETAGFGEVGGRPVLMLPGRPEAALAACLGLGRPLLDALSGAEPAPPPHAPLLRKISSVIGLSEIVFVRRVSEGLEPLGSAELPLHRLLSVDGAVLVPPDREGYPEGMPVPWMPL